MDTLSHIITSLCPRCAALSLAFPSRLAHSIRCGSGIAPPPASSPPGNLIPISPPGFLPHPTSCCVRCKEPTPLLGARGRGGGVGGGAVWGICPWSKACLMSRKSMDAMPCSPSPFVHPLFTPDKSSTHSPPAAAVDPTPAPALLSLGERVRLRLALFLLLPGELAWESPPTPPPPPRSPN
jgi:hypothetical protein